MTESLTPRSVLEKYWGYTSFRELQQEIIESVLRGEDTLGLLPTGGGKSLTFQIPAMILPGLTLVVTPLISLMKDQVDNLRSRDIRACMIHSGLSRGEQKLAMDRCRYGHAKMLYVSPEKLQSKGFVDELGQMDVSLIVVDEAHCISQWGYDFRPSYLRISELRHRFPQSRVMALTASATPEVSADIMDRLEFRGRRMFVRSFARDNISYIVRFSDHKQEMLLRVLRNTSGSAIVYVRSRRRTREIAELLVAESISAEFYHAGLSAEEKNERQNRWKSGQTRVMVATNAFGMGIDKPDVRTVVHVDLPSSLEEYYQEAGRAGRDGCAAYAVVIASPADKGTLTRRLNEAFPDKDVIRRVYELVCNFLEVAVGSGYGLMEEFDFSLFCDRFRINPRVARSALGLLTSAGYIEYVDEISTRSRLMVIMDKHELYSLNVSESADRVFQMILRSYTGLFSDYVNISESLLSARLQMSPKQVYEALLELSRCHAVSYVPQKTSPYVIFTTSRELPKHVMLPRSVYEDMRQRMERRIEAMKRFVFNGGSCRVASMLRYFGESDAGDCGRCDVCRGRREAASATANARQDLMKEIVRIAGQPGRTTVDYIASQLSVSSESLLPLIRELMDRGQVRVDGFVVTAAERQG
ncbi:MAG: RecQ family ATP-dependent DNA helicase [Paramuribaculum sp.]|nr:RecQ family ATP-dependent DNA helicase [Paramuribaculum sp.]MDE6323800.1 RecQ family ATP-dependent DNA helicase [Paramuribaculum sp.]